MMNEVNERKLAKKNGEPLKDSEVLEHDTECFRHTCLSDVVTFDQSFVNFDTAYYIVGFDSQHFMKDGKIADDGKVQLINGRTGEPFENRVSVGVMDIDRTSIR